MRLDLNHYGLIGFQKEWRAIQCYSGINLLEGFIDDCIASGVDGCCITSEEEKIKEDSVDDRFGITKKIAKGESTGLSDHRDKLQPEYETVHVGSNYFIMRKEDKMLCFFNSQAARITEEGEKIKALIIGDNKFPDQSSFTENLPYLMREDITIIPKKISQDAAPVKEKTAMKILKRYAGLYDSMVGFNAQENTRSNGEAKRLAEELQLPYVAISNKHSFSGCKASIDFNYSQLDFSSEEGLLVSLKRTISLDRFRCIEENEGLIKKLAWQGAFFLGTLHNRHQRYTP